MSRPEHGDDVVWLDDGGAGEDRDAEDADLAGQSKPPLRRRTRVVLGLLAAAVLGTAVTVGALRNGDEARPTPDRTTTTTARATGTPVALPPQPPRRAVQAIRTVFPSAELTSFSAIRQPETDGVYRIFNLRAGDRLLTITVSPPRPGDTEEVNRTATSVEIAQRLEMAQVSILLRIDGSGAGAPSATDYAGIQRLVQDPRLLALR